MTLGVQTGTNEGVNLRVSIFSHVAWEDKSPCCIDSCVAPAMGNDTEVSTQKELPMQSRNIQRQSYVSGRPKLVSCFVRRRMGWSCWVFLGYRGHKGNKIGLC